MEWYLAVVLYVVMVLFNPSVGIYQHLLAVELFSTAESLVPALVHLLILVGVGLVVMKGQAMMVI